MVFKCSTSPRQQSHTQCIVHKSTIPVMFSGEMQAQRTLLLSPTSSSSTHAETTLLLQYRCFKIFLNYIQVPSWVLSPLHAKVVNELQVTVNEICTSGFIVGISLHNNTFIKKHCRERLWDCGQYWGNCLLAG